MKLPLAAASLAIALIVAAVSARQVRDIKAEPKGAGSISGQVVADGSDARPLSRSTLSLSGAPLMTARQVVADDAGRFTFSDLPAGQFVLTARKANFSVGAYGAKRPGGTGTPIPLKDGQRVDDIRVVLSKWGSISGTIYDQSGEPVEGMSVEGLKYTMRTGRRTLSSVYGRPAFTDDRGAYTLYGLDAGDYFVATGPSPDLGLTNLVQLSASDIDRALQNIAAGPTRPPAAAGPFQRVSFAPVFFPGATDLGGATMLTLKQGEDRTSVDIHLQLVPAARLDVIVTRPDGEPPAGAQVVATAITQAYSMDLFSPGASGTARSDGPGRFSYDSLAPGRYVVTAKTSAVAATPTTPAMPPLWALTEVTIDGSDQAVTMTLMPGVTVSGRIVFDGTTIQPPAGMANIRVGLNPAGANVSIGVTSVNPAPTGAFVLNGVAPGQDLVTAIGPPAPPGWTLRSAMTNGIDALDLPLDVRPGQPVDGVVITYTDRPTELSGTLQAANGTPAPDFTIVVFAVDRACWTPFSRRSVTTRPGMTGQYVIRNLPPGDYYVGAVTDIEPGDWYDPAFLERLIPASTKVTLGESEKRTFDLKIAR